MARREQGDTRFENDEDDEDEIDNDEDGCESRGGVGGSRGGRSQSLEQQSNEAEKTMSRIPRGGHWMI